MVVSFVFVSQYLKYLYRPNIDKLIAEVLSRNSIKFSEIVFQLSFIVHMPAR